MKYKEGDFGYWWTEIEGNPDIEGQVYNGDINCSNKNLTSLKGCPAVVNGGYFSCSNNQLTSLKYCPKQIKGSFYCYNIKIKDKNEFKNIKFCERVYSDFDNDEIMNFIRENNIEYYI